MRKLPAADIHKEINKTLGESTVSLNTVKKWMLIFSEGDFDLCDKKRSGRPSMDVEDRIQELIEGDKHVTTRDIGQQLEISNSTAWHHLKNMGKQYLATVWVPHHLSPANKERRVSVCQELMNMHRQNNFINQMVTGDEVWIYWENVGHGGLNKSWRGDGDTPATVPIRNNMTVKKHLATVFWDTKGLLLIDVLPRNQTIDAEKYCLQLDKLKMAIIEKRRRLIGPENSMNNIFFLHDNARPHSAVLTQDKLRNIGFTVLPHPPYSPDLAPSDFYLFSPMKSSLKGQNFSSVEETMQIINEWFDAKPRDFFHEAFAKLPGRWNKCINHGGEYFCHLP